MTRRFPALLVPLVALLALLGSGTWLAADDAGRSGPGRWADRSWVDGRAGMMSGAGRRVPDLAGAWARAERFAADLDPDLRVGEVMRFANHFYAELEEPDGTKATEVLVDPRTGAVVLEPGPAMMWNTRYGMMPGGASAAIRVSVEEARERARQWLDARGDLTAAGPKAFPGYYTWHTMREQRIAGMISVNAVTGAVWYHGWHGRFIEMAETG